MLGTTKRTDGNMQVTYNGWPLYYFIKDKAAGDTTGQNVQGSWFVINPSGSSVTGAPAPAATSAPVATAAPAAAGAMINAGQNSALGSFLVNAKGMTLYVFANDTANASNCSGTCATNWPPLLTSGAPVAGMGVNAALLGTLTRSDGGIQVTYNGMPLYGFAGDNAAGDTKGQGIKNIWHVIDLSGKPVMPAPAAAPAPASSGGSSWYDATTLPLNKWSQCFPKTSEVCIRRL